MWHAEFIWCEQTFHTFALTKVVQNWSLAFQEKAICNDLIGYSREVKDVVMKRIGRS